MNTKNGSRGVDLTKVKEIKEVRTPDEVNALLKGNWVLINSYIALKNEIVFVLGLQSRISEDNDFRPESQVAGVDYSGVLEKPL